MLQQNKDYESTCNPSNPFRCELGDLSSKLETYNIGGGVKHFTETENYLASWHNGKLLNLLSKGLVKHKVLIYFVFCVVIGRSVVIHVKDKGADRLACADIIPQDGPSSYNMETLNVKNTSKTR